MKASKRVYQLFKVIGEGQKQEMSGKVPFSVAQALAWSYGGNEDGMEVWNTMTQQPVKY
jgi:hypothetical protein